jgi:hypothetical protein
MEVTEHQTQLAPQDSINQHSLSMMKYAIIYLSLPKSFIFSGSKLVQASTQEGTKFWHG